MRAILQQLNAVPGVVGTMICDSEGSLLAEAFPPAFDRARLRKAATVLVSRTAPLEGALGATRTVDLQFATARVVMKASDDFRLVFLCDSSANLSLLGLSAAGALRGLAPSPAAVPLAPAGQLFQLLQRVNAFIEQAPGNRFKLRGQIAVKSGLALELIDASTPDDPDQLQRLRAAARDVLGRDV